MRDLTIEWRKVWYSPYLRGTITAGNASRSLPRVDRIFYHPGKDQLRIYSDDPFDGALIRVNRGRAYTMRKRGSYGKLYISAP